MQARGENWVKHIFVVNPAAGGGRSTADLLARIRSAVSRENDPLDFEIYLTKAPLDAQKYVAQRCREPGRKRFYSCGGDGTLNEVVNGCCAAVGAEVAVVPAGSGNDFVRVFQKPEAFADISRQIRSGSEPTDLLRAGERICINSISIGLDSLTIQNLNRFHRRGRLSYYRALAAAFLGNFRFPIRITADGVEYPQERFVLTAAANGTHYGGGFKAAPKAVINDGMLDLVAVRNLSRIRLLALIGKYKQGRHLDEKVFQNLVLFRRVREVRLKTQQPVPLQIDGEYSITTDITVKVLPAAVRLCRPDMI